MPSIIREPNFTARIERVGPYELRFTTTGTARMSTGIGGETREDADHDHAKCLAGAQAMGVPAEWAHRPETYLSM